jgi:hypothetical protein
MGEDGRRIAERQYDWRILGDQLEALLKDACTSA